MISSTYSIEAFAEVVKDKDSQTVIIMAVEEATVADRLLLKNHRHDDTGLLEDYSRQLKQLINYHRYAIKPRQPNKTTYNLYMKYWGTTDTMEGLILESAPTGREV